MAQEYARAICERAAQKGPRLFVGKESLLFGLDKVLEEAPFSHIVKVLIEKIRQRIESITAYDAFAQTVEEWCARLEPTIDLWTNDAGQAGTDLIYDLVQLHEMMRNWLLKCYLSRLWAAKKYKAKFEKHLRNLGTAQADSMHSGVAYVAKKNQVMQQKLDRSLGEITETSTIQKID